MRLHPPGVVQLDQEDAMLLAEARLHRRLFAAGRPPGQEELEAVREAHVRYANRDRGSETEKGRSQRLEEIAAAFRKDTATRVANITR